MVSSMTEPIRIEIAGVFLEPLLQKDQKGKVIGITSKGIFLLFDRRVIFLTSEDHKNPFTLQISNRADFPQRIVLNQEVKLEGQFLNAGEKIYDLRSISRFVPAPIPLVRRSETLHKSSAQIVSLFQALNLRQHQDSLLYVVDALLNGKEPQDADQQSVWQAVQQLRRGARDQNLEECESALQRLVGRGKGLTPSGDDLISGILLIQNSLNPRGEDQPGFLSRLNAMALSLAQSKSTWISANLIEASTLRLVDERVGRAAQLLLGLCRMDAVTIAGGLESFGNSSGIDAFTGMVAALLP